MDAKGKFVAHAHHDRVGLVPFVPAQVRKDLAMFVRLRHRSSSPSRRASAMRTLGGFPLPKAPRVKMISPVFSSICAQAFASARSSASLTTLSICAELTFGSLDTTR